MTSIERVVERTRQSSIWVVAVKVIHRNPFRVKSDVWIQSGRSATLIRWDADTYWEDQQFIRWNVEEVLKVLIFGSIVFQYYKMIDMEWIPKIQSTFCIIQTLISIHPSRGLRCRQNFVPKIDEDYLITGILYRLPQRVGLTTELKIWMSPTRNGLVVLHNSIKCY